MAFEWEAAEALAVASAAASAVASVVVYAVAFAVEERPVTVPIAGESLLLADTAFAATAAGSWRWVSDWHAVSAG